MTHSTQSLCGDITRLIHWLTLRLGHLTFMSTSDRDGLREINEDGFRIAQAAGHQA